MAKIDRMLKIDFFNDFIKEIKMIYYKVLRSDLTHHGFKYQKGVNTDTIPFNPVGSCVPGGIYFTDADHIHQFLNLGSLIATVEIPDGTETVKDGLNKWRTH